VQRNVAAYYSTTRIHGVAVGNEVFGEAKNLSGQLVPAMVNVHDALVKLGLDTAMKVSTPIAFTALKESWPPSAGRFWDDIAQSVMKPMIEFLEWTGSYLTINAYPYKRMPRSTPHDAKECQDAHIRRKIIPRTKPCAN